MERRVYTPFAAQFLKYLCFQGIVCTPYPHQEYVVVLGQKNTTESLRRIEAGFMAQIEYILALEVAKLFLNLRKLGIP